MGTFETVAAFARRRVAPHPKTREDAPMSAVSAEVPTVTLNNGVEIPQLGFGVFQIEPSDTKKATLEALEVGYRHIDTAQMYGNEREVGEAVREFGVDRSEVFVTSKLNNPFHAPDDAMRAFDRTLMTLDIEYVACS
jgi:2,5-diketo-D-gluconate reductase A